MSLKIIFKHMDSSPALESYATEAIDACVRKYVQKNYSAMVTFEVNNGHIVRCHLHIDDKMELQVDHSNSNMYAALDQMIKKLDYKLSRLKDKQRNHRQKGKSIRDLDQELITEDVDTRPIDASDIIAAEHTRHWEAVDLSAPKQYH